MASFNNTTFGISVSELAISVLEASDYFKKSMRQSSVSSIIHVVERINSLGNNCYKSKSTEEKLITLNEIKTLISDIDFKIAYLVKSNVN